ncbi:cell wall hydrolase [Clostridium perfringens]|nr:cell wall hydrolase [Clostridium perfringens]
MGQYDHLGKPIYSTSDYKLLSNTDLIARMLYSEAQGESYKGKQGCYYVYANRLKLNINEFGKSTYEILVGKGFFAMNNSFAMRPNTSSQAWLDCCKIAVAGPSNSNPVGNCLYFNTNARFSQLSSNGKYNMQGTWHTIKEKVVIGNHTFFRIKY